MHSVYHLMKYSFSGTECVYVCVRLCAYVCSGDDGEAVDVFNKHKTAEPHTLTALASNNSPSLTHVHARRRARTHTRASAETKAQTCRKFMYK